MPPPLKASPPGQPGSWAAVLSSPGPTPPLIHSSHFLFRSRCGVPLSLRKGEAPSVGLPLFPWHTRLQRVKHNLVVRARSLVPVTWVQSLPSHILGVILAVLLNICGPQTPHLGGSVTASEWVSSEVSFRQVSSSQTHTWHTVAVSGKMLWQLHAHNTTHC